MSEDKQHEDLSQEKETDETEVLKRQGGEQVLPESEHMHTESSPPTLDGLRQWVRHNRKKLIAAGLAVLLLTSGFALGRYWEHDSKEGRRPVFHSQRSLAERLERNETRRAIPRFERPLNHHSTPKSQEKQLAIRILGEDGVKEILEKELETPLDEIKMNRIELVHNPKINRYRRVAPGEQDDEEENETEMNVEDKLFYQVEVEVKGKKEELKIGAETGKVYYSTAKTKA